MDTTAYIPKYMVSFICGGISGVASKFLTMPFDVLKKRYQILRFESNSVYMQPSYIPSWKLYYNPVTSLPSYTSYVRVSIVYDSICMIYIHIYILYTNRYIR